MQLRALLFAALPFALAACGSPSVATDAASTPDAAALTDAGPVSDVSATDAAPVDASHEITYWRDIAPIVNGNCTQCHAPGGIGPMPLGTYADVRPLAALIAAETGARRMPPWQPAGENCRALQNPLVLSAEQLAAISTWAANGAPEGNAADYVAPTGTSTQRPLPPTGDVVVRMDQPYAPTSRNNDDYHCFIMDPQLTAEHDVVGVRVTPGNAAIVHHVILFEVREAALPQLQALDDAEPGPGYTCFGSDNIDANVRAAPSGSGDLVEMDTQMIAGWAPGGVPGYFPGGTGVRLKPGSRLVMQVHYNLSSAASRGMTDQSRVDLYFSPSRVASQAIWAPQVNDTFHIPAGTPPTDPAATVTDTSVQQYPLRVFGVAPHMHLRGRSIRVDLLHADQTSNCLIDIPDWNFHWQQAYWYVSPFRPNVTSGHADAYKLTCVYDNTPANQPLVDGVQEAPHELHWGEGTDDEMCLNFFYVAL